VLVKRFPTVMEALWRGEKIVLATTNAQAERQTPPREHIEGRSLLGEDARVADSRCRTLGGQAEYGW